MSRLLLTLLLVACITPAYTLESDGPPAAAAPATVAAPAPAAPAVTAHVQAVQVTRGYSDEYDEGQDNR